MAIKCVGVRNGLIWDKVRFKATKTHKAEFSTMLGDKVFYVEEGQEFCVRRPKSEMWEKGDKASCFTALITSLNQHQFNWYWQ